MNHKSNLPFSPPDVALLDGAESPLSRALNEIVVYLCRRCWPQGFDVSATAAPETFTALKAEMAARGRITINSANSADTIYGCPTINVMSRAWHDWAHLRGGYGFNVEGEANAWRLQSQQIRELVSSDLADYLCAVLEAEIVGQSMYYKRHQRFVQRQREFVETYLEDPALALSRDFGLETGNVFAPSFA